MTSNLSLCSLLESDQLIGSNFNSWLRKLKIVLEYKRILYILTDPALEQPASNSHATIKDTYQKWISDQTMIRCIMLDMINDEFSHRFENAHPKEMIQVLNKSFGILDNIKRHKTSYAIFNARMRDGATIIEYVLYMIVMIELHSKFEFPLHEYLEKDVIFNSLYQSFHPFLTHYRMIKPEVNFHG